MEGKAGKKERDGQTEASEREREGRRGRAEASTRKPPGQQITVYSLYTLRLLPCLCSLFPSFFSPRPRLLCIPVSSGRPWLAHEVNNHQKSQCLSRAAALCAPTRAPDANTTPPGLYYELLELLHRRRIFTCNVCARSRSRGFLLCLVFAFFPLCRDTFFPFPSFTRILFLGRKRRDELQMILGE